MYSEIEKYLITGQLEELLKYYQECFLKLHQYEMDFKKGVIQSGFRTDQVMKELAGIYSMLNIVVAIVDTWKTTQENTQYNLLRIEKENNKEKVISSLIEKEASEFVNDIRRVRNIFEAYRDSCDRLISICQSSLKAEMSERRLPHA